MLNMKVCSENKFNISDEFKISDSHYAATWLLDPRAPKVEMPKIVSERIKIALGEEK